MSYLFMVWIICTIYCFLELMSWKIEASEEAVDEVLDIFDELNTKITLSKNIITKLVVEPSSVIRGFLYAFLFWTIHSVFCILDNLEYKENFKLELKNIIRENLINIVLAGFSVSEQNELKRKIRLIISDKEEIDAE